jgi:DNA-binding GntR family transcriptional regulator
MAKNGDLKNQLYYLLKDRLMTCQYEPNSMINESQLAAEFNSSRTPIREALYRLEQDGLVEIMPKKGIRVTNITIQDVLFVFQARIAMEPVALEIAGPFLNPDDLNQFLTLFRSAEPDLNKAFWQDINMHTYFVNHCGNPFIIDMMQKVFAQSCRISIASRQNGYKINSARQEHIQILEALLEENYLLAANHLRCHLESCKNYSLNYFNSAYAKDSISEWPRQTL